MALDAAEKKQLDFALAMARFSSIAVAILVASNHRRRPVGDGDVESILKLLATSAASAPEEAKGLFDHLAETIAGKHLQPR